MDWKTGGRSGRTNHRRRWAGAALLLAVVGVIAAVVLAGDHGAEAGIVPHDRPATVRATNDGVRYSPTS